MNQDMKSTISHLKNLINNFDNTENKILADVYK